jgi:DNA-directed RNA polymerase subunit RPC12/RpoP
MTSGTTTESGNKPSERPSVVCLRCGNQWTPRKTDPKKCPGCQNPGWNKPRTRRRKEVVPVEVVNTGDRIAEARRKAEKLLEGLL